MYHNRHVYVRIQLLACIHVLHARFFETMKSWCGHVNREVKAPYYD